MFIGLLDEGDKNVTADHAASHVGKAEGMVTILRSCSHTRMRRNVFIPLDIIARVGDLYTANVFNFLLLKGTRKCFIWNSLSGWDGG